MHPNLLLVHKLGPIGRALSLMVRASQCLLLMASLIQILIPFIKLGLLNSRAPIYDALVGLARPRARLELPLYHQSKSSDTWSRWSPL